MVPPRPPRPRRGLELVISQVRPLGPARTEELGHRLEHLREPHTQVFSLPLCDWCPLRVYSLSPHVTGPPGQIYRPEKLRVSSLDLH